MDKYDLISVLWVECPNGMNVIVEAPNLTVAEGDVVLFENDIVTCHGIVKARITEYKGSPVVAMLRETSRYYYAVGVYAPTWTKKEKEDESIGN